MKTNPSPKRSFPAVTVAQLKRYGYTLSIIAGMLSMTTVLLFGSPTFALSPVTRTFNYFVYPVLILAGVGCIHAIFTKDSFLQKFEQFFLIVMASFFVTKFSLTLLAAPALVPLALVESWYWMLVGVWTLAFLAYDWRRALLINLIVYSTALAVTILNTWLKVTPGQFVDHVAALVASNFRLALTLILVVVLGYIKHQWMIVEEEIMQLRDIAHVDALTNLSNRRRLNERLTGALANDAGPLSVILFDLDEFKSINDRFGHIVGDKVLQHTATLARQCIRAEDTFGRWGGEEFLVICYDTHLKDAESLAERLRQTIAATDMTPVNYISASFGVAEAQPGETVEQLIDRADQALYAAKRYGRNRVESTAHLSA